MPNADESPPAAVVGAGAVGSALARGLVAGGCRVRAVLNRSADAAVALAEQVEASVAGSDWDILPETVRLVLVCVSDDAIVDVAAALAALDHPWPDTIVAHTSGARTAEALEPVAEQGAATMSFHPMQTVVPDTPPKAFEGIVVGLEGDDEAVAAGEALAHALGARPVRLSAAEKVRYHCAAAFASNGLVALLSVVEELLGTTEVEKPDAATDLVAPLVEHTWTNLDEGTPEGVVTGPVARGDVDTVRAHLDALREATPHLVPLYAALSTELVRIAVRGGHLSPTQADALLGCLYEATDAAAKEHGE